MDKLENLLNMIPGLEEMVKIDNTNENPLVDAYNLGAEAMRNQVTYYVRNVLMIPERKEGGN